MRTITRLEELSGETKPIVFAAGAFDGIHRGHQTVLARARDVAESMGGQVWVLTFEPHPLKVLAPEKAPALLTSTPHRLQLLRMQKADGVALLPFTRAFASQEPEGFIEQIHATVPALRAFVVGSNWTFGRAARGEVALLRKLGAKLGFEVHAMPGVKWDGALISSTRIRRAVVNGELDAAEAMLGRPFSIYGTVVHGTKLGRKLGFPTANIDPHNEVRPPPGIYASLALVDDREYIAAAFLTATPDPRKGPLDVVEVHLLDADLDLYDQDVNLRFIRKIRDEEKFEDLDSLKRHIAADVAAIRQLLAP
ncbi:MAG: bifunctional riboflavin kinase/FAD synthetase [Verrucomicrobia bacterium]|nr:bifunctional riboflavin kinase/FAD synthetase [Verrucomicrobiota bacterium]